MTWNDKLLISALRPAWTDAQWLEYCDQLSVVMNSHGPFHAWLVLPTGQGMTSAQRKKFSVDYRDKLRLAEFKRVVFLTDSQILRGVLKAMAWLVKSEAETRGFKFSEWSASLDWLAEQASFDRAAAETLLANLCTEVNFKLIGLPRAQETITQAHAEF